MADLHRPGFIVFCGILAALLAVYYSPSERFLLLVTLPDYYVIYNANVYTMDDNLPTAQAFAVRDGRFIAVGSSEEVLSLHPTAASYNVDKAVILPGLIDAHAHLMNQGKMMVEVDLFGATSVEQVVVLLNAFVAANPLGPGEWLLGRGWDQTLWPSKQFPTKEDLDTAFPTTPVWLRRIDGHAGWANSATIRSVPTLPENDPEGGSVVRDPTTNEPTGIFVDNAMSFVDNYVPEKTEDEKDQALQLAIQECNRLGLTGMHDAGVPLGDIEFFKRSIDRSRFNIRNYVFISCNDGVYFCPDVSPILIGYGKNQLTVRSVKLYLDGALGSWGAAMLEPYTDNPTTSGLLLMPQDQLEPTVQRWVDAGYQVNTHAIGDRANRLVINAYENVINRVGRNRDLRLRIEHAQILSLDDIPRVAPLGIIPSVQPTHCTSDKSFVESRIGPERVKGAYIWSSFINAGAHLPLGSDFPVERVSPWFGIHAAITRQDGNEQPEGGWYPAEKLSITQALKGFTIEAAFAAFQEKDLGSISSGKLADFIVIDRDPYTVRPIDIRETVVKATVFNGQVVYQSKSK